MSDAEYELRLALAKRLPQMHQPRDRWARFWAKFLCLLAALIVGGGLLWLGENTLARFVGQ